MAIMTMAMAIGRAPSRHRDRWEGQAGPQRVGHSIAGKASSTDYWGCDGGGRAESTGGSRSDGTNSELGLANGEGRLVGNPTGRKNWLKLAWGLGIGTGTVGVVGTAVQGGRSGGALQGVKAEDEPER